MYKTFTGYCPAQNKDFSVKIEYINSSDLQNRSYTKGIATCNYASYGGACDGNCPIINSAPEEIHG